MDSMTDNVLHLRLDSPQKTLELGQAVAKALTGGLLISLIGELGAGKTVLTRGIAIGLGIPDDQITSPTFTLIQEYPGPLPLVHVDLYRLERQIDMESLGLGEYFDSESLVVIEWADRLEHGLPSDRLEVRLTHEDAPNIRLITISGTGPKSRKILTHLGIYLSEGDKKSDHPHSI
jgi:tRNA threonylcarbamoyladenosine biosynthesis protein TsaE